MKHIAIALIVPLVSALLGKGGRFTQILLVLCGLLLLTGEAIAEDAKEAARTAIARNFDFEDCPAVAEATKMLDGSIDALCTNGETFRIGTVGPFPDVAMRCSAVAAHGITGCSHWGVNPAKVRAYKEQHEMFS